MPGLADRIERDLSLIRQTGNTGFKICESVSDGTGTTHSPLAAACRRRPPLGALPGEWRFDFQGASILGAEGLCEGLARAADCGAQNQRHQTPTNKIIRVTHIDMNLSLSYRVTRNPRSAPGRPQRGDA